MSPLSLLDVNTTFFTILNYPMSYIEFFGTLLNIWSVWLISKKQTLSWPVGIVAVVLFMILFYQIQLYSDFIEQIYFLITGFYGWWFWYRSDKKSADNQADLSLSDVRQQISYILFIGLGTLGLGYFVSNLHTTLPALFPIPAVFPYLDAFTTVMSFTATLLMIHKKVDSWVIWIIVDIIGIWLYFSRGVKLISILYIIFLILAIKGLINWTQIWLKQRKKA